MSDHTGGSDPEASWYDAHMTIEGSDIARLRFKWLMIHQSRGGNQTGWTIPDEVPAFIFDPSRYTPSPFRSADQVSDFCRGIQLAGVDFSALTDDLAHSSFELPAFYHKPIVFASKAGRNADFTLRLPELVNTWINDNARANNLYLTMDGEEAVSDNESVCDLKTSMWARVRNGINSMNRGVQVTGETPIFYVIMTGQGGDVVCRRVACSSDDIVGHAELESADLWRDENRFSEMSVPVPMQ